MQPHDDGLRWVQPPGFRRLFLRTSETFEPKAGLAAGAGADAGASLFISHPKSWHLCVGPRPRRRSSRTPCCRRRGGGEEGGGGG